MWFLTFVYKNLARRPLRSLLTVMAIAIAIGAFLALVGVSMGFERSFLQIYEGAGIDIVVVRSGGSVRLNSSLDQNLAEKIKEIPGVEQVVGGLADMVAIERGDKGTVRALVQGWEPGSAAFDHLQILQGRTLKSGDTKQALLGTILARNMDAKLGDTFDLIEGETFTVVGTYETTNVFENGAMVVPLGEMQRIMDRKGMVTGFSVIMDKKHKDKAAIEDTRKEIEKRLKYTVSAMSSRDHVNSLTEINLAKGMAWLTSLIALLIGTFGMMNTMVMSIHERTREIGTLRAVGWRRGRVMRMILAESLLLSVLGALVGALGAFGLLRILTMVPQVSGFIDGRLDPLLIASGFLIAVIVGLVGGLLPAIRAARLLPVAALRHE